MKKLTIAIGALALGALLSGCGDDKKDAMPAPTSTAAAQKPMMTAAANTASPGMTAAAVANDDIPSEADFEDQAEKDITADNLESELDKIDKEIGQ